MSVQKAGRIQELDWLRGYAVLLVVALHIVGITAVGTPVYAGFSRLNLGGGVDIFFAISGFVISQSLHDFWTGVEEKGAYWRFMKARFWRLWPPLAFWSAFVLAGAIIFKDAGFFPSWQISLSRSVAAVFYLSNFAEAQRPTVIGFFWSLAVEWQFYMLFPVVLVLVRNNVKRLLIMLVLWAVQIVWRPADELWWLFRHDGILMGIFAYMASRLYGWKVPAIFVRPGVPMATTTTLITLIAIIRPGLDGPYFSQTVVSAFCGVLVFLAAADRGAVSTCCTPNLLNWAGSRSYSLYLAHIPVTLAVASFLHIAADGSGQSLNPKFLAPAVFFLSVICTIVATEISFRTLERIRFKRPIAHGAFA